MTLSVTLLFTSTGCEGPVGPAGPSQPVESYGWEHRNCGISGYEYGTGYGKFYSRGLKKFTSSKLKTAKYVCEWCQTGVDKLFPEKKIGKSDMICKSCLDYINNYVEY